MLKERNNKFILGFWNYNTFKNGGADEVAHWADLGLTVAMMPMGHSINDPEAEKETFRLLDELQKYDMKLVLMFDELTSDYYTKYGADEYRKAFSKAYDTYGKHPAVLGVYPGEEPMPNVIDDFVNTVKVMFEIAPEWTPFIDLGARSDHMDYIGSSGIPVSGFGNYSQMEPEDRGTNDYFTLMYNQMQACKKYNMDCWPTLLSSGHYRHRPPKEVDYIWQINTAAICGCTGIYWFRLYDKLTAADYRGSPMDEYGQPNGMFYRGMKRAQTRFNIHHGEIIMKMHHDTTFFITRRYGGYPAFPDEGYSLVKRVYSKDTFFGCYDKDPIPGIVSFFKDEEGYEYVAIMNNSRTEPGDLTLEFDKKIKKAEYVYFNGKQLNGVSMEEIPGRDCYEAEIWLAPGQMEIIRIQ